MCFLGSDGNHYPVMRMYALGTCQEDEFLQSGPVPEACVDENEEEDDMRKKSMFERLAKKIAKEGNDEDLPFAVYSCVEEFPPVLPHVTFFSGSDPDNCYAVESDTKMLASAFAPMSVDSFGVCAPVAGGPFDTSGLEEDRSTSNLGDSTHFEMTCSDTNLTVVGFDDDACSQGSDESLVAILGSGCVDIIP